MNINSVKILDSLAEGIYVIDKEFKIRFVNKAAYQITNKKPTDVIGQICRSLCKSDRCEIGCPVTEVLQTGKNVIDMESTLQDNNGNLIPVLLNASILNDVDGDTLGGIISFKKNRKSIFSGYNSKENMYYGIIGKSKKMVALFNVISEISYSFATVLITGETGVGKELIANAVKETSSRNKAPFVKVNCAALPPTLLASELFGHVKGAFTDAKNDRIGRFEFADGGTIFLDEIAEIPIAMQAQLLRVIQDGTFERLGDSKTRKTDIRIIAATNKNLLDEISKNMFREDLFYRLNVVPLFVPSLRERKEDIIYLTKYFIEKFNEKYGKNIEYADNDTMDILMNYDWPGNIRELENCIEYSIIRSKRADYICSCSLPSSLRKKDHCNQNLSLKEIELNEKTETILALLRQNNWNKSKVAEILGINRSTIHRKLKKI
ncbi:MAG: sigma 54-interacting transcriptional regulator [Bacteroidetes bacterium]|nr:sigma 54-interacting transcriptional regulator [Bacteroidota bacterium]MBU1115949.1 sigma 54-interacting transcriptional regulator [Bacteroidota bacterium]MBU1798454.1 sigma 54-interacting transcriptional regulator [Bacteroidota bacterium]